MAQANLIVDFLKWLKGLVCPFKQTVDPTAAALSGIALWARMELVIMMVKAYYSFTKLCNSQTAAP